MAETKLTDEQKQEIANQVVAEPKKRGRKKGDIRTDHLPKMNPGDNTQYTLHSLEIAQLPEIDTNDLEQVTTRSTDYFKICAKNDMKPTVAGYALALGVNRITLWGWLNKPEHKKSKEVDRIIRLYYNCLNAQMEDLMQNGKINPVAGIFLMKNNLGYKDQQEVVITPNVVEESTPESLIAESGLLSDDDIID